MDGQDEGQTMAKERGTLTREERLKRWGGRLSGADGNGRRQVQGLRNPETRLGTGLWLHTAARADLGLELTEWEHKWLAPIAGVLGEEEVRAVGRLYREHRETGARAMVPGAVASRSFDEPFSAEELAVQVARLGGLAANEPNVAWVNRTRVLAGENLDTEEFTDAAAAAGYGLTVFNGAGFTSTATEEEDGADAAALAAFRAKLEWDGFFCSQAAGDQGGGRDEIYWTAACNTDGYQRTSRTEETGAVSSGHSYRIDGGSGGQAFFDASFTGSLGSMMITCWEADQSNDAWYSALGKALKDAVEAMKAADYVTSVVPTPDFIGHMMLGLDLLATFWEYLRNNDDHVLTRGFAFNRDDLKAMYHSPGRRMELTFNARSSGMGHFRLGVKYTGAAPPGPPPSGSFDSIVVHWPGLLGSAFTSDLDAACMVPTLFGRQSGDVYLFKGDRYARYSIFTEEMLYGGPMSISNGWPALRGTRFTSGFDAACAVPGSFSDVYLFKGDEYVRYNTEEEKLVYGGVHKISDKWTGLRGTAFTSNLDAACAIPGHNHDIYLFKGDRYVRYDTDTEKLRYGGVTRISEGWPDLADTDFAHSLQAACAVPNSSGEVYLFKGSRYVRYED